jgi:glutathione S-transferase
MDVRRAEFDRTTRPELDGDRLSSRRRRLGKAAPSGGAQIAQARLAVLSNWLDGRDYLEEGRFTVADLLMTTVLRIPRHPDLIAEMPTLEAYRLRCEERPAFKKALAAQMSDFSEKASAA